MSKAILVGISGPSSSGKTTLARLIRSILLSAGHNALILHEDDFYRPEAEIPIHAGTGHQDWDCLGSIDDEALRQALKHIKEIGALPSDLQSKEDRNCAGKVDVDASLIERLEREAKSLAVPAPRPVVIVDGFLLFAPTLAPLYALMEVKLFLPTTHALMASRRSTRSGYVTLEGFWEDPPDYVDKVVWPNYARDHAFMFRRGDVEGEVDDGVVSDMGVDVAPTEGRESMDVCLEWAWRKIEEGVKGVSD